MLAMGVPESRSAVDAEFIRRGLEVADLNAVRVALYQQTHDHEVETLPVAAKMSEDQRTLLIDKAVAWLERNASTEMPIEPPADELRKLLTLATHQEMSDLEFEARRELPGFQPFPMTVQWEGDKPQIPEGYLIAIIGSGVAGIAAAVQCELLDLPYVMIERQPRPGGTWQINRYPDVRVDTPSINYEYSFEKKYKWSEYFCRGEEVRTYLDHIADKFGLRQNTRYNSELKTATFDETRNLWMLEIETPEGGDMIEANVVITAVGLFANPRFPTFEGAEDFKGEIVHTARWPAEIDLKDKNVALIGNGSTGVQILGAIARQAKHVYVCQRTAQWLSPRDKYGHPMEIEHAWVIANFPGYWNWWRYMAMASLFHIHDYQVPDPEWQARGGKVNQSNDQLRAFLTNYLEQEIGGRKDLIEKLMPDHAPFSRRPVVDNGWYRALTRDNVELVTERIARLTPDGIETIDGKRRDVDVIVTATGFEVVRYLWPTRYLGRDGRDLHETWDSRDGPRAYLGMMVPGFPNMFMLHGPNAQPVSGGTAMPSWYAVWSGYAAQTIMKMLQEGKSRVEVRPEAYERYNEALDVESAKLLLMTKDGGMERNYYVNAKHGRLQVNAPWLSPDFHRMCTVIDWNDLDLA
jgi:4-hydroxyacetophenone monooxygenase